MLGFKLTDAVKETAPTKFHPFGDLLTKLQINIWKIAFLNGWRATHTGLLISEETSLITAIINRFKHGPANTPELLFGQDHHSPYGDWKPWKTIGLGSTTRGGGGRIISRLGGEWATAYPAEREKSIGRGVTDMTSLVR